MTTENLTTYRVALDRRARQAARDLFEDWIEQGEDPEDFPIYDAAHTEADSWDWVVYHHHAQSLCDDVWSEDLRAAEDQVMDTMGPEGIAQAFERGGLGGVASLVAYWIVYQAVASALEDQLENLRIDAA